MLALPNLPWDPCDRCGIRHLDIFNQLVEVFLYEKSTTKIMLNVAGTSPCVSLRCLKADVRRVSERWVEAIEVPMRSAEIAFEHLAFVPARDTTLCAQDRLLITVKYSRVIRLLIAITAVLCPVLCQWAVARHRTLCLQRELLHLFKVRTIASR